MAQGEGNIIIDVGGNTRQLEKDIAKVANQSINLNIKGFGQPLGKISGQLGEFEKSLAASNARVLAFGASAGAIYAVEKALGDTLRSAIKVQKALQDINVILNAGTSSLKNFGAELFNIAKDTGQSFDVVAKAATELSRQGLGIEQTLKRTSDALILTRLSGLDTVSSVEALTAAINSFNNSALDSTQIVNKLAAVDAGFAVSSGDLAEAIKRVGSSAEDAGVSFDQLIAIVTSAQQITSRGGSVIGNSLKTIFTRLQRPKVLDDLEAIGVVTRDQEGNIRPLIQILSDLSKSYENLSGVQKSSIAETVGGVFQINILKAALGDLNSEYSIYSRALAASTGATDEAIQRNEQLNQTLDALINKTVQNLTKVSAAVGEDVFGPAIKKILGGLNTALESFDESQSQIH
jgi:TP901 family phage tail tape measure protein